MSEPMEMRRAIDLNCDLGEGAGHDAALLALVSSANIACGVHAGDAATMQATVALARQHGVAIGAHPGVGDRGSFGRAALTVTPEAAHDAVRAQTRALQAVAAVQGAAVTFVKPHGALYTVAAREPAVAQAVAEAVRVCGADLALVGLAGSHAITAARRAGVRAVSEAFVDRTYRDDGSLTPRTEADALIDRADVAIAQALAVVRDGRLRTREGGWIPVAAETLCLHGDGPHAVAFARALRAALAAVGIAVRPVTLPGVTPRLAAHDRRGRGPSSS